MIYNYSDQWAVADSASPTLRTKQALYFFLVNPVSVLQVIVLDSTWVTSPVSNHLMTELLGVSSRFSRGILTGLAPWIQTIFTIFVSVERSWTTTLCTSLFHISSIFRKTEKDFAGER